MSSDDRCGVCEITRKVCDDLTGKGIPDCCPDCTHGVITLEDEVVTLRAQVAAMAAQVSAVIALAASLDREAAQLDTNDVSGNAASFLWSCAGQIRRTLAAAPSSPMPNLRKETSND